MRAAPAVEATLDRGGRERILIALLHGLGGAALATWCLALADVVDVQLGWAAWLACVVASVLAGLRWASHLLPAETQCLRWDGQVWALRGAPNGSRPDVPLRAVTVAIDLGSWVLLRLQPTIGIGSVWRIASAGGAAASWHGLRLALRAHAGAAAPSPQGADA
jgi:hypothetical protein